MAREKSKISLFNKYFTSPKSSMLCQIKWTILYYILSFLFSECCTFSTISLIINIRSYFITESLKKMPNNNNNNNTVNDALVSILHLTTDIHYTLSPTFHEVKIYWVVGDGNWVLQYQDQEVPVEGDNDTGIKDRWSQESGWRSRLGWAHINLGSHGDYWKV